MFFNFTNIVFFSKLNILQNYLQYMISQITLEKFTTAVPLLGGISLFLTISVNLFTFLVLEIISLEIFLVYFISIFSFFVLGLIDDYKNINPKVKLSFSIIFLTIFFLFFNSFVIYELSFSSFSKIVSLGILSIPFTILCFMLLQNAINMIDGVDGLLSITSISILIICLIYNSNSVIFLSYLIISTILNLIIFMIFNFKKTFMGDSGTFAIATIALIIVIPSKIILF